MAQNQMSYSDFKKKLHEELLMNDYFELYEENIKFYDKGFRGETDEEREFVKNTNVKYFANESEELGGDFLLITTNGEFANLHRFNLAAMYDEMLSKGWGDVVNTISDSMDEVRRIRKKGSEIFDHINEYDAVKDSLIIRPINYRQRKLELKDAVVRLTGDIALVLYILLKDEMVGQRHNVGSTMVKRVMMEKWGVTDDEVFDAALLNTREKFPPRLYLTIADMPGAGPEKPYEHGEFMSENSKITTLVGYPSPTVTTTAYINGAIAMFYPGVTEKLWELSGNKDYYVVFTGTNDVVIHPEGTVRPYDAVKRLKHMNKVMNAYDEILTNKLYKYEHEKGALKMLEV